MKIDIFPHILPVKYKEAFQKVNRSEAFTKMHNIIRHFMTSIPGSGSWTSTRVCSRS